MFLSLCHSFIYLCVSVYLPDPESVFEASLACSRCVHSLNISSIEHMIEEGLIGTALATFMFSRDKLQKVSLFVPGLDG